jgi:hypothetical protein
MGREDLLRRFEFAVRKHFLHASVSACLRLEYCAVVYKTECVFLEKL